MKLEQLVHDVEARLTDLGRRLLGPGPREQLREELEAFVAEIAGRRAALKLHRAERDAVRARLRDGEAAVALLPAQIESSVRRGKASQAVRQALELDRLRQQVAEDRAGLPRLEQTCWSLQFHLRVLERRLTRLEDRIDRLAGTARR
jgi:chromosome segregation ATPase